MFGDRFQQSVPFWIRFPVSKILRFVQMLTNLKSNLLFLLTLFNKLCNSLLNLINLIAVNEYFQYLDRTECVKRHLINTVNIN